MSRLYHLSIYFDAHFPTRRGFAHVVIVITNHSHDDTGDLYIGADMCTTIDEVSGFIIFVLTPGFMVGGLSL